MLAFLTALLLLPAAGWTQGDVREENRGKLASLAAGLSRARGGNEESFRLARTRLEDELLRERAGGVLPSAAALNGIADAVLDAYVRRPEAGDEEDEFPVSLAARYASSSKAKKYLIALLARPPGKAREVAVEELAFSDVWKGDRDVFAAVRDLERREEGRSALPVAVLQRLDPERALPEVLRLVETTEDPALFYKSAGLLSNYRRLDLLQRAFRRVPAFAGPRRGEFPVGLLDAVDPAPMLGCLRDCAGAELKAALEALPEMRKARRDAAAALRDRRKSEKDPAARKEIETALEFLLE
jgi:hypothetical protein